MNTVVVHDMTVELTDDDRDLVRWFAETRLEWESAEIETEPGCWWIDAEKRYYQVDEILGWPGFGLAVEEARRVGLKVSLEVQAEDHVVEMWPWEVARFIAHGEHADPALAAHAALRDALGGK